MLGERGCMFRMGCIMQDSKPNRTRRLCCYGRQRDVCRLGGKGRCEDAAGGDWDWTGRERNAMKESLHASGWKLWLPGTRA